MGAGPQLPGATEEPITRAGLREATLAGVRWVTMGRVLAELTALSATVVLARLIPPSAFGLAAVAFAVTLVAGVLASGGLATALVQRKEVTPDHLAVATFISLVMGTALTAGIWGAAELLAPVVDDTALWLVKLASLSFLLTGAGVASGAILQRRLDFRMLTIIDILSILALSLVTVGLAIAGLDGEALILGALARAVISTTLLVVAARPALPRWSKAAARDLASTAVPSATASLCYQGFRNVDYAIVGATLGAAQAGFYWRAFQLGVEYQNKITTVMGQMALPVYSRSQDMDHMRALRERIVRVHAAVIFPSLAIFIAIAPVLIPYVYGARWEPAVLPAQILAGAGMTMALGTGLGPLVLAAGKARALAWWNVGLLVAYTATVLVSATAGGIVTVCAAVAGFYVVQLLFFYYFLLERIVGIPMRSVFSDAAAATTGSAALLLVAWPLALFLDGRGAAAPITCVLATGLGLAVYLLTVRGFFSEAWADLLLLARRVLPRQPKWRSLGRRAASGET
jgi:O-antigen/teichoic acid export membrane protein